MPPCGLEACGSRHPLGYCPLLHRALRLQLRRDWRPQPHRGSRRLPQREWRPPLQHGWSRPLHDWRLLRRDSLRSTLHDSYPLHRRDGSLRSLRDWQWLRRGSLRSTLRDWLPPRR